MMVINPWTKKYMLRPVAHCKSGCMWPKQLNVGNQRYGNRALSP